MAFWETNHEFRHRPTGAPYDKRTYQIVDVDTMQSADQLTRSLLGRLGVDTGFLGGDMDSFEVALTSTTLKTAQELNAGAWYNAFGYNMHAAKVHVGNNIRAIISFPAEPNEYGAELAAISYVTPEYQCGLVFQETYTDLSTDMHPTLSLNPYKLQSLHHSSWSFVNQAAFADFNEGDIDAVTTQGKGLTQSNQHLFSGFTLESFDWFAEQPFHIIAATYIALGLREAYTQSSSLA